MRPINRIPQGLLSFFGLKSLGKNPEVLLDELRGVIDLKEWYLRTNAEQIRFTQQIVAGGLHPVSDPHIATGELVVPAGEWWYIHAATLVLFGQTGVVWAKPGIMTVRNAQPNQYFESLVDSLVSDFTTATAQDRSATFHARPRVWLPPLTSIGGSYFYLDDTGMAPGDVVNFNIHLSVTKVAA